MSPDVSEESVWVFDLRNSRVEWENCGNDGLEGWCSCCLKVFFLGRKSSVISNYSEMRNERQ